MSAKDVLRRALAPTARAARPLVRAARRRVTLYEHLALLGWDLENVEFLDLAQVEQALAATGAALAQVAAALAPGATEQEAVDAAVAAARAALETLDVVGAALLAGSPAEGDALAAAALAEDLASDLVLRHLAQEWPLLLQGAAALGIVVRERATEVAVGEGDARVVLRRSVTRTAFRLATLRAAVLHPARGLLERAGRAASADGGLDGLAAGLQRELAAVALFAEEAFATSVFHVTPNRLEVEGLELPIQPGTSVAFDVPLTDDLRPRVTMEPTRIVVAWNVAPQGDAPQELALFEDAGFSFSLASAADHETGVTLSRLLEAPTVEVTLGLAAELPPDALVEDAGGALRAKGVATLRLAYDEPTPTFTLHEASVEGRDVRVGGAQGLTLTRASVTLRDLVLPQPPGAAAFALEVEGALALAEEALSASARATLGPQGFLLESSGRATLGDVALEPLGAEPVLRIEAPGGDDFALAVAGRVALPLAGAARALDLRGSLHLARQGAALRVLAASASGTVDADLALAEGLILRSASAALAWDDAARTFTLGLAGAVGLAQGSVAAALALTLHRDAAGDVSHADFAGVLDAQEVPLGELGALVRAKLALAASTIPGAPAVAALTEGHLGLFPRADATTADPADARHHVTVRNAAATLTFVPEGVTLRIASAEVELPPVFDRPDGRPTVALTNVVLSWIDGAPRASGAFTVRDAGLVLGGATDAFEVRLVEGSLALADAQAPTLRLASGYVKLPLPAGVFEPAPGQDAPALVIDATDSEWTLDGLPSRGALALRETVTLALGDGFDLAFLGAQDPGAVAGTGLAFTRSDGRLTLDLKAAVRLGFPVDLVESDEGAGGRVWALGEGGVVVSTAPGTSPRLRIDQVALGARALHLGRGGSSGSGLLIEEASVALLHPDALVDPASGEVFAVRLSGIVKTAPADTAGATATQLAFDVQEATFRFPRDSDFPEFTFGRVGVAASPAPTLAGIPLVVEEAWIETKEARPGMPLTELLHPMNLTLGVSVGLHLSGGSAAVGAGVRDLTVTLDERGRPKVSIDGFMLGVDGLALGNVILSGALAVQGFETGNLLFAGKVGGTYNGTGLTVLVAFRLKPPALDGRPVLEPLGLCLDVSGGAAGIPLGQTGILVTGASGGVSFANTNGSPCDFKTYVGLDDEGRRTDAPTARRPEPEGTTEPAPPTLRPGRDADCPQPCPPPSLNILCQRHPDPELRSSRAIVKFSSLDRPFLKSIGLEDAVHDAFPEFPVDLSDAAIDQLAAGVAATFGEKISQAPEMDRLFAGVPPDAVPTETPEPVREWLVDPKAKATSELASLLAAAIRSATADLAGKTPYDVVADVLYRGFPCPDVSLLVTGTVSYAGVSAYASITGGVSVSTAGSVGVVGSLNVIGIPVGRLRAFVTATDDEGRLDPSLCGDLRFSVGPLDLGQIGFIERLLTPGGSLEQAMGAAVDALPAEALAECVAEALGRTLAAGEDPKVALGAVDLAQLNRLLHAIGRRASEAALEAARDAATQQNAERLADALRTLAIGVVQAYQPRIDCCGIVQPRLFGVPLTPREIVAARAWATPEYLGAEIAFSPSFLVHTLVPFAGMFCGMDSVALGFSAGAPSPNEILVDVLAGRILSPQDLERVARRGVERVLDEGTLTLAYSLSPFGLDFVNAGGRVIIPRLLRHPALGHPWQDPDTRVAADGTPFADRMEVLDAALRVGTNPGGRLTDTAWTGALDEMAVEGRAPLQGLTLVDDYFPHGGIVGAGYVEAPLALLDAPDLALLGRIVAPAAEDADWKQDAFERARAAFEYVRKYVLATRTVGSLAFYLPAPNPPSAARALQERADVLEEILRAGDDLPASLAATYPAHLAFFRGTVEGTLLGVPLGRATMHALPAGRDGRDMAELLVEAELPEGSWLGDVVGSATLRARIRQPPEVPIRARFRALAAALGADSDALAQVSADAESDAVRLLDAVRPPVVATLDPERRFAHDELGARLGLERLATLRPRLDAASALLARLAAAAGDEEEGARVRQDLVRAVLDALAQDLPRVDLEASLEDLDLGALSAGLLDAAGSATLSAYSPRYDPESQEAGLLGEARRNGGVLLRLDASLELGERRITLRDAEMALVFPSVHDLAQRLTTRPALRLQHAWSRLRIPGTGLDLHDARLLLTSAPAPGEPFVRITGSIDGLRAGRLRIAPLAPGGRIAASIEVWPDDEGSPGDVRVVLDPARVDIPLLAAGTTLRIHGADGPDAPFTFSLADDWSVSASFERLDLVSPYDPDDPPILTLTAPPQAPLAGTLRGEGLRSWRLKLEAPASAVALFPHAPHLPQAIARVQDGTLVIEASSSAAPSVGFELPPLAVGALRIHGAPRLDEDPSAALDRPVRVKLTPYGFTLFDAHLSLVGLVQKPLRMRSFVIDGFGRFSVTSRGTRVDMGLFAFSTRGVRFAYAPEGWSLVLLRPRIRILEKTPFSRRLGLDLDMPSLAIATDGAFHVRLGPDPASREPDPRPEEMKVLDLLTARGTLEFGSAPGAGPYLRLLDVELDAGPLGAYHGIQRVEFTRERAVADLGGGTLAVPGLAEVNVDAWRFEYVYPRDLSIVGSAASARLLDAAWVGLHDVRLFATPAGRGLTARANAGLALLPGVLEIAEGSIYFQGSGTTGVLDLNGEARILRGPHGWLLRAGNAVRFTLGGGVLAGTVRPRAVAGLADLPGLLAVAAGAVTFFTLRRTDAGFTMGVQDLDATLLGKAFAMRGDVDANGRIEVRARPTLTFGPFDLRLEEDLVVAFNPRLAEAPAVTFPAATLHASLAGWPEDGVPLGGVEMENGTFDALLDPFQWLGIDMTRDEDGEELRVLRDAAGLRAQLASHRSFFGARLTLAATLREDRTIAASARGTLDVTIDGTLRKFGEVTMGFDPANEDYPFSIDVEHPVPFRLSFGRHGGRACMLRRERRDGEWVWVEIEGSCWTSPG